MWPKTCCLPPNFAKPFVLEYSWENVVYPEAFENNSLCKIRDGGRKGANRVYYGRAGSKTVKTREQYESYGYIVKRMVFIDFASPILWFIPLDNIGKRNTKGLSTYLPRLWLQGRASLFLLPHKHEPAGNKHRWIDKYKNRIKCN